VISILRVHLYSVPVFIKHTRKLAFHVLQFLCLNHSPVVNIESLDSFKIHVEELQQWNNTTPKRRLKIFRKKAF